MSSNQLLLELRTHLYRLREERIIASSAMKQSIASGWETSGFTHERLARAQIEFALWSTEFKIDTKYQIARITGASHVLAASNVVIEARRQLMRAAKNSTDGGDLNSTSEWVRTIASTKLSVYARVIEAWESACARE